MSVNYTDFDKIWASTSPLTPYSFSDSQYKEGWNFIGSTPPARQMWDFLQKQNDEKSKYLFDNFDNYLPLNGGTLTGDVFGVTPPNGDNSKKLATTAFVTAKAGNYLPLSGGTLTGVVDGVTPTAGDDSTKIATTEFVNAKAGNYLPLSGGTLTGVVDGVTPTAGDDSKKLATTEYVQEEIRQHGNLPVGYEYFTFNPSIPQGSLPLFGGEYSRTTYADLWAWVQTQSGYLLEESAWQAKAAANGGNVPFYSKGDGSTTFRVPALKCWVKGVNSISEVGGYLPAGLPNITGSTAWAVNGTLGKHSSQGTPYHQNTGALSVKTDGKAYGAIGSKGDDAANSNVSVNIDASLSNPIYGNSNTVQPESIVGMWLVKAYSTVTNVGSTDVSAIAQGLTEAETRISTLEMENQAVSAVVVETYRNGTEWYRVWSDGWVEQGGQLHWAAARKPGDKTVTLYKVMADTNYNTLIETIKGNGGTFGTSCFDHTTTAFTAFTYGHADNDTSVGLIWYVCGQGA